MEKRKAAADIFMEQSIIEDEYAVNASSGESLSEAKEASLAQTESNYPSGAPSYPQAQAAMAPAPAPRRQRKLNLSTLKTSEELQIEKEPLAIRETGAWFWRRVIVPPNAYVVHTRIRRAAPVTLGLGISFRYKPAKDSYLIVPAAMQTIGVVANCISKEKQGINVLAYVQWQIADFAIAYKRLDFSDRNDPLGIVNAQLREQAEAAIKDKIATMSVEEVLTDKEPVIEELTARLKAVAEGRQLSGKSSEEGLGIKIVTVQIREAIVCSETLWTDLQSPFRNEKRQAAQFSRLGMQSEINRKELETRKEIETHQAGTAFDIETIRQKKETETNELRLREESIRFTREQETSRERTRLEEETAIAARESAERRAIRESELEVQTALARFAQEDRQKAESTRLSLEEAKRESATETEIAVFRETENARLEEAKNAVARRIVALQTELGAAQAAYELLVRSQEDELAARALEARIARDGKEFELEMARERGNAEAAERRTRFELEMEEFRQKVRNLMADNDVMSRLVERLPEIAQAMPEIKDLRVFRSDSGADPFDGLSQFLAKILAVLSSFDLEAFRKKNEGSGTMPT